MRFLCLHGIGTSSQLLKMQTSALRYEFGDQHTYEFVQGTMPWRMAPELSAISKEEEPHYAYFDPENATGYLTAYNQLESFIAAEGPFDGVFGFSQGAGLAIIYMARKLIETPKAPPPFRCAILFSPTAVGDPFRWFETGEMRELEALPGAATISTPAAFIWGSKDESAPRFEALFETFDSNTSWKYVFEGGHEIPNPTITGSMGEAIKVARRAVTQAQRGLRQ
ncbi:hypothetical protein P280DRAFT_445153 [Massarina eburnea CBS 473.64]|uniref:Serine hydrolase domain-containing protein n=1 Tax=Massarina eburnea CBS 473.64 TaxID=1395130 RepID=A0A6A6SBV3_9PLEO|nr:hypothetical protein P280DRAFT_445153 [Massarina eburnea CBS 473.64]